MTVRAPEIIRGNRAASLEWLARNQEQVENPQGAMVLACLTHPSLRGGLRQDAFADYAEAVRVRDGLGTGELDWREEYPELTCADAAEEAFQLACARADEALAVLLHGPKGGGR